MHNISHDNTCQLSPQHISNFLLSPILHNFLITYFLPTAHFKSVRLNTFRAAQRSSSGALNRICSLWFIYQCGDRPLSRLRGKCHFPFLPLSLDNGRSPHGYINQRLHIRFRAPDDERCAARNVLGLQ